MLPLAFYLAASATTQTQRDRWQHLSELNEVEYEPVPHRRQLEHTNSAAFGSFGSFGSHALTSLVVFVPSYASLPVAAPLSPPPPSPMPPPRPSRPPLPLAPPPPPASPGQNLVGLGCTDPEADNYVLGATREDGSCTYNRIVGCTDSRAANYIPQANVDSGQCIIPIIGCTIPWAVNYNPDANLYNPLVVACDLTIRGCTDSRQLGYNPEASQDDGSCIPRVYGCLSSHAVNYNASANSMRSASDCRYVTYGCMDQAAINYNPLATAEHPSGAPPYACRPFIPGCSSPMALNYWRDATTDDGSCYTPVLLTAAEVTSACFMPACSTTRTTGCALNSDLALLDNEIARIPQARRQAVASTCAAGTGRSLAICYFCDRLLPAVASTPGAANFTGTRAYLQQIHSFLVQFCTGSSNPLNQCSLIVDGCVVPTASNYNPLATMQIMTQCVYTTAGCKDSSALNYDARAQLANNTMCRHSRIGCALQGAATFDPDATQQCLPIDRCCVFDRHGCTEPSALNFNALANIEDGSCRYPAEGCMDPGALNYNTSATVQSTQSLCTYRSRGCRERSALNYASFATVGCEHNVSGDVRPTDPCPCAYSGCAVSTASNFQPKANTLALIAARALVLVNGSTYTSAADACTFPVVGCRNSAASNYNALATGGDASYCQFTGCLRSDALNYNPTALVPGLCRLNVTGCTDTSADNYNAAATVDDGTCILAGCTDSRNPFGYDPRANTYRCNEAYHFGCTDSTAFNYDPAATHDPTGTACMHIGCLDSTFDTYGVRNNGQLHGINSAAYLAGGACCARSTPYCPDPQASNYNAALHARANQTVTVCGTVIPLLKPTPTRCTYGGCLDPTDTTYNPSATWSDDSRCSGIRVPSPKPPPPKPPAEYGSLGLLPGADEVEVIFNPILLSRPPSSGDAKTWRTAELPPLLPGWGSRGSTPIKSNRARQGPDEAEQRSRPASRTSPISVFAVWDLPSPSVSVSVADESSGKDEVSTGSSPGQQLPHCHTEGPSPHGRFYYRGEEIRLKVKPSRARERQEKRSLHKMRKATVSIQSKARGLLAKAKYGAVRHALVQIQANARRLAARRFLAIACSAALFIQLRFRALRRKVAHRQGRPLPTASAPGTTQGSRRQSQAATRSPRRSPSRSPRRSQQQGPISLGTLSAYMYTWESDFAGKSGAPARSLVSPGSSAASLYDSNRDADCGRPSTPRDPSARLRPPRWTRPQSGLGLTRPIVFEPHRKSAALSAATRRAYNFGALSGAWSWESDGTAWSVDTRLDRDASALLSTAVAGLMAQRMREVPSTPVSGSSTSRLRTPVETGHRPPVVIPDSAALKDGASEPRPLILPRSRSHTQRPVVETPPVHVASRWPKKPPVPERHRTKLALQAATASVARSSSMPVLFLNEGDGTQEWVELASAIAQTRPKLLRPRYSGRLDP